MAEEKQSIKGFDKLMATAQSSTFLNQGEADAGRKPEEASVEIKAPKESGKSDEKKPSATRNKPVSKKPKIDLHPWMSASQANRVSLMIYMPEDLKMLLDGVARIYPGYTMTTLVNEILEDRLKEMAKDANLPLPDRMKD